MCVSRILLTIQTIFTYLYITYLFINHVDTVSLFLLDYPFYIYVHCFLDTCIYRYRYKTEYTIYSNNNSPVDFDQ